MCLLPPAHVLLNEAFGAQFGTLHEARTAFQRFFCQFFSILYVDMCKFDSMQCRILQPVVAGYLGTLMGGGGGGDMRRRGRRRRRRKVCGRQDISRHRCVTTRPKGQVVTRQPG